ncbi:NAD(P)/FAD-dependent oxidoreductase [Antrihabitans cavernicola]|uniref:NAD(P)/FAD-dependent oxidoreductase n=1 Tax=Antrihabitans cavernicola TaxID=2495913 RepID=A0A5A7SCB4_9NOCA|nr:NAD(P)/FAD-dependent oxidoreductase [Spelaeibacter cavernicola]KAA0022233.1 NAD(P)/FAD-dependent oxidoreductase [Spelaeibacter cavernicola]
MNEKTQNYDVAVIGGGAAGLNGALMLARARRSVVVIDAGEPRNAPADGVHGFITRDGIKPAELVRIGQDEVRGYGGTIVSGSVHTVRRDADRFVVVLDDGVTFGARRLLVTTGLVDELPDVTGLAERFGRDVLHCPYCHGWEVRDQAIGILATGPFGVHQALMFRQWSPTITLLLNDAYQPSAEEAEQFAARGIAVVEGKVAALEIDDDALAAALLDDGTRLEITALAVMPRVAVRAAFLTELGLVPTPHEMGIGDYIVTDATGSTVVPGVWAAGNVADPMLQVGAAAAAGARAGAVVNADLMNEDTQLAVAQYRRKGALDV